MFGFGCSSINQDSSSATVFFMAITKPLSQESDFAEAEHKKFQIQFKRSCIIHTKFVCSNNTFTSPSLGVIKHDYHCQNST